MALVPLTCDQGEQSTEQIMRQTFLFDNVTGQYVIRTDAVSGGGGATTPTTGTLTQPAMTTVSASILSSGAYLSALITNNTDEEVFIGLGFVPTITAYSLALGTGETYVIEVGEFEGDINGITASNPTTGDLNVTSLTA